MQFFALVRPSATDPLLPPPPTDLLQAEGDWVAQEYSEGFLRQLWTCGDAAGVAVLIEADSLADASRRLGLSPLQRAHITATDLLVPLEPFARFAGRVRTRPDGPAID